MANKKKLDAAQILSTLGATPKQATMDRQDTMATPTTQAEQSTLATLDTLATTKDTQQQYRHIAINNDLWEKVKALQGQTGAPLNHIINRALCLYIQEIEKAHGELTTNKIKLI